MRARDIRSVCNVDDVCSVVNNFMAHITRDFNLSRFKRSVRVSEKDFNWVKENKGKKSAAGFLEFIINQYKNGNYKS